MILKKAYFAIDEAIENFYEGYETGKHWNGWSCPLFTKEISKIIAEKFSDETEEIFFDEENNAFVIKHKDEEPYIISGADYEIEGEIKHLYALTDGWCWDCYTKEEMEQLSPANCYCEKDYAEKDYDYE